MSNHVLRKYFFDEYDKEPGLLIVGDKYPIQISYLKREMCSSLT